MPANNCEPVLQSPGNSPELNLDMLVAVWQGVQEQIRFADSKAAVAVALNTLLLGFSMSMLKDILRVHGLQQDHSAVHWASIILFSLYFVATTTSIIIVMCAIVSRLGEQAPRSKVFFGHIASEYGRDYGRYTQDMRKLSDHDWADDVAEQIVEVSHIAKVKHRLVRYAVIVTMISIALWVLTLVAVAAVSGQVLLGT